MNITKAPFNYIGNKYRILPELCQYFPQKIETMVDLFCGGCDVTVNVPAEKIYANDINYFVIEICREFQRRPIEEILAYIDETIAAWQLTKEDKAAYERFRAYYNRSRKPLDLYILMCFSFNYQFRFNAAHEYNNPFGKNRSSFNAVMRANLVEFKKRIANVTFSSEDFPEFDYSVLSAGDFLYADPPYLLSRGSYNDGRRGFKGWSPADDARLFEILRSLSARGVRFALSNVIEHKGRKNVPLAAWAAENDFHIHDIHFDYNNCNYQTKNKTGTTKEVLITNY